MPEDRCQKTEVRYQMPVLFEEEPDGALAYTINHINCLVDGDTVFTRQTHELNTGNIFIDYVTRLFGKADYYYDPENPDNDNIIDADSYRYYYRCGDIHCGTNVQRERPTYKWWE